MNLSELDSETFMTNTKTMNNDVGVAPRAETGAANGMPLKDFKKQCHDQTTVNIIRRIYCIAFLIWVLIVIWLELFFPKVLLVLILMIPFIAFGFGYVNASGLSGEVEDEMFQNNYLAVGLVLVVPLLSWINEKQVDSERKKKFTNLAILALIFTMLSMVDVWVPKQYLPVTKHVKSVFQTISLTLLIVSLYFYLVQNNDHWEDSLGAKFDNFWNMNFVTVQ